KRQLDDLRIGWELLIDIDTKIFELARVASHLFIEALKFHDIENISVKFSGNNGFHIGIPFEAFPDEVNGTKTSLLFPEGPKIIASYLKEMIKEHLIAEILKITTLEKISKEIGKPKEEFLTDGKFDPFKIVDIDTVLISSRHMFRAPYSLNEKSGLISIPIKPSQVLKFKKEYGLAKNVKADISFLDRSRITKKEASGLITQAFDWAAKQSTIIMEEDVKKITQRTNNHSKLTSPAKEEYFPPCIQKALKNGLEDGKKRFLFTLVNFLYSSGYGDEEIELVTKKWNKKNPEPLRENYLLAQLSWHKRQKDKILPPNCDNPSYYLALQICRPDGLCRMIKNPTNYVLRKVSLNNPKIKKKRKKSS
ncbi:MAG: hypothetical protein Q8O84_02565, partial [Nanoarchaeota archaeon]|nr:hypothetical protein [Nanoarchaeota archaeon]